MIERKITASAKLPEILAVTGERDYGPSGFDGDGSTNCPHCGSRGRYVVTFICADGSRRGAMRGCFKLFPIARDAARTAALIQKAFDRVAEATVLKRKPAAWWLAMVEATEAFAAKDLVDVPAILEARAGLFRAIWEAEASRQEWLTKNGFGRNGRRGARR